MSLSVVCATHDPGPPVATMLGQFRDVADEIVVAVDTRVDHAELGEYAAVADRLLRYEYAEFARSLGWLHRQCSCEWILLMGSDEMASPALISQLPDLISARDAMQYWIPTRWTFPDAEHWLDERPWYPDYHNRLVRNDASLWFPGLHHTEAAHVFPARYLEAPLYHFNCVIQSIDERRRKVAEYERMRPGLTTPDGTSVNDAYYLPEDHARLPPRPVPSADRAEIAAVLGASPSGREPPALDEIPLADRAEVDRYWAGSALAPCDYRASIVPLERDARMCAGEHRAFSLRVTNDGEQRWPWRAEEGQVRVAYRIRDSSGELVVAEGHRTAFAAPVAPGTSCVLPATVLAPSAPGEYEIEFDIVHEHVRWFDCPARLQVTVIEAP